MANPDFQKKEQRLSTHLSNAREIPFDRKDRWVIFSDLHMGNGGRRDDFVEKSGMFHTVLSEYYHPKDYRLVLNGDVEELHKFTWRQIRSSWSETYEIFDAFSDKGRLIKTVGNHDSRLIMDLKEHYPYTMDTVIGITGLDYPILIYHGHQVSAFYEKFNDISRIGIRYFATPLGIMNYSVAHDSRKRHHLEHRIYNYSRQERIVSIIGHTHRPLFESLTKADTLRFRIEYLLNRYRKASENDRDEIRTEIDKLREDLISWRARKRRPDLQSGIYAEDDVPVPCVFNSGTVIGKRGMTCIEIKKGKIRLVHWFDDRIEDEYFDKDNKDIKTLRGGHIHRLELRQAPLDYVMDSIRLLT
jgi:hypothetical protein